MANVTGGNSVSSSAQLNADVVTLPAMANDSVDKSNVKTGAVGTDELLDGEIVNADISASAAIDDSKLAQINDADKVHGASFTNLESIPSDAGVIPSANLSGSKIAKGTADVTVTNTTTETALLTESIAAGLLGTINGVILKASIQFSWTGQGSWQTLRVKYGATTIATLTYDPAAPASQTGTLDLTVLLLAGTATNAQDVMTSAIISGMSDPSALGTLVQMQTTTCAEDSTGALNLVVTAQHQNAAAELSTILRCYTLTKFG